MNHETSDSGRDPRLAYELRFALPSGTEHLAGIQHADPFEHDWGLVTELADEIAAYGGEVSIRHIDTDRAVKTLAFERTSVPEMGSIWHGIKRAVSDDADAVLKAIVGLTYPENIVPINSLQKGNPSDDG